MSAYRGAVSQFVTLVIQQRDDLCAALREDAADAETQRRIRNFGQVAGRFPSGKATLLIAEFEPRDGFGALAKAFYAANAAVGTAGVGAYFLPMLKAVNDAQRDLYRIVRKAFEESRYQVFGELQEHAQAVCELWDAVGGNETDKTPTVSRKGMPLTVVIRNAEQHLERNPWPGVNAFAKIVGCAPSTMSKAVRRSAVMAKAKSDSENQTKFVIAGQWSDAVGATVATVDEMPDLDGDVGNDDLLTPLKAECRTNEDKEKLAAMPPAKLQELAAIYLTDPDTRKPRRKVKSR